jgi:very-short-patch-repair endonuclease
MERQSLTQGVDRAIAQLAAGQHGVVARWQLLQIGVTPQQATTRLKNGRFHETHRGVYLVGHGVPTEHARDMAALLALHLGAVLSHESAANLWELLRYPASAPACVTVPPERSATRPGIRIHRVRLGQRDIRRRAGMSLTSPPRTILDLAGRLGHRDEPDRLSGLESLVAEAQFRRLASEAELQAQVARNPRAKGVGALRRVLELPGGPRRTRSPAELAMLRLLRRAGITGYEVNGVIHGYEVDFLWRDLNLIVEVDGYDAHSGRVAFERDRAKIATLIARGLRVMPVTGRQIKEDEKAVVERLIRAGASTVSD